MNHSAPTAIEFFSGIGGFAEAVRGSGTTVAAAFDQSAEANQVHALNHPSPRPNPRNLDSIPPDALPPADLWWMSPPCTPYSRRGRRRDLDDPRAASLVHLFTRCLPVHRPRQVLMENVLGFAGSRAHALAKETLHRLGYRTTETSLCPTAFGIPMQRPRWFLHALLDEEPEAIEPPSRETGRISIPLRQFLDPDIGHAAPDPRLLLPTPIAHRHGRALNIVDPARDDAVAICFTRRYGKSLKAAGSFIAAPVVDASTRDKAGARTEHPPSTGSRIRRFSPREILRLLSFPDAFQLPDSLPIDTLWRLVGNSVSLACLRHLLHDAGIKGPPTDASVSPTRVTRESPPEAASKAPHPPNAVDLRPGNPTGTIPNP